MLPAGMIREIDPDTEIVYVDVTRNEIKDAPEFDEKRYRSQEYRNELRMYYGDRRG